MSRHHYDMGHYSPRPFYDDQHQPRSHPLENRGLRRARFRYYISLWLGLSILVPAVFALSLGDPIHYFPDYVKPKHIVKKEFWLAIFPWAGNDFRQSIFQQEGRKKARSYKAQPQKAQPREAKPQKALPLSQNPSASPYDSLDDSLEQNLGKKKSDKGLSLDALSADSKLQALSPYIVQLTAKRDFAKAQSHFFVLSALYPDLFANHQFEVKKIDLGAKGVFYRLYVISFQSKEGAEQFCDDLHQRGEECLVRKR